MEENGSWKQLLQEDFKLHRDDDWIVGELFGESQWEEYWNGRKATTFEYSTWLS